MYTPAAFSENDQQRIKTLIDQNGFATLISAKDKDRDTDKDTLNVSHAPVQFDADRKILTGHLARANPHAAALGDGDTLLVIFHGPHGYISPTWYANENPKSPKLRYKAT